MHSTQATTMTTSKFIETSEWDPQANRYMQPRTNDKGLKTIAVISNQKNKKLHLQLPLLICWGISDYTDQATGESDGRFTIKLQFSGNENASADSTEAWDKLKKFEQQVISDAVANSEAWFGQKKSRELIEDQYLSYLKGMKNKDTNKVDFTRGCYFRPRVNVYSGKWDTEVFDPDFNLLFPSEDEGHTPVDYVPSGSEVTCGVECKSIWIGATGSWGITWALKQCVVTPKITENTTGKCQLRISDKDKERMYNPPAEAVAEVVAEEEEETTEEVVKKETDTYAENSDEESEPVEEVKEEAVEEVKEEPAPKPKKTVVKKAAPAPAPAPVEEVKEEAPAPKKKVVRKKA